MKITAMLISLWLLTSGITFAQVNINKDEAVPFTKLFHNLDAHFLGCFTHNFGSNHVLAIATSYGLMKTGADWKLHQFTRANQSVAYSGLPSLVIGALVPVFVPVGLYYYGKEHDDQQLQITALALGQAALLGVTISSGYKAVTGRKGPEPFDEDPDKLDYSDDFKFGILKRGVFDGWPSGHTTTAVAMATTWIELYPENRGLKVGAIGYAAFIAVGVSVNVHWASDVLAGTLIGYSIGKTVGRGFRKHEDSAFDLTVTSSAIVLRMKF